MARLYVFADDEDRKKKAIRSNFYLGYNSVVDNTFGTPDGNKPKIGEIAYVINDGCIFIPGDKTGNTDISRAKAYLEGVIGIDKTFGCLQREYLDDDNSGYSLLDSLLITLRTGHVDDELLNLLADLFDPGGDNERKLEIKRRKPGKPDIDIMNAYFVGALFRMYEEEGTMEQAALRLEEISPKKDSFDTIRKNWKRLRPVLIDMELISTEDGLSIVEPEIPEDR